MERYHPRAGLASSLVAIPTWLIFVLNSMLGFFPSLIFADGGIGSKFHFYLFIQDRFLGGSPDPVWSEAGVMTSQEWLMLALALPATFGALYCLRKRPEFGAIDRDDLGEAREALEVDRSFASTSGTGDANTAAIIDSVIGEARQVDSQVVTAALGEMGAIAAAHAAANPQPEPELEPDQVPESEPELEPDQVPESEPEPELLDEIDAWTIYDPKPESESVPEPEAEMAEIPEMFREPVIEQDDPLSKPSTPDIPAVKSSIPGLAEVKQIISKATEVTVNAAKDVASKTVELTERVVEKVRPSKPESSVMPVRPPGLPPMAEWDPYEGEWMLLGRPIRTAPEPEVEAEKPTWARDELEIEPEAEPAVLLTAVAIDDEDEVVRKTPVIPIIP